MSHETSAPKSLLRTLLVSDLVGSTRLVEKLGDEAAARLFSRHDSLARGLLSQHEGQEIDKTDGFLLLFRRPISAVLYALDYHQALAELSRESDVELTARVGIHLAEVMVRENPPEEVARGAKPLEVEGLAKPMAARLMSLAEGRQTLLTRGALEMARRAAVDKLRTDQEVRWLEHGLYKFKGVEEPIEVFEAGVGGFAPLKPPADSEKVKAVPGLGTGQQPGRRLPFWLWPAAAAVVAAALVLGWWSLSQPDSAGVNDGRPAVADSSYQGMIAVLPFENLGAAEDEYFSDGISEEIISRLSAVRALGVVSRRSSMLYKGSEKSIGEIGGELNVDYVLVGTVRWNRPADAPAQVRIIPALIRAEDAIELWSDSYLRQLDNIFTVQSEIAGSVVDHLNVELLEPERQVLEARTTEDSEAYQAYLRGLDYANRSDYSQSNLRLAERLFERAVELDPRFALAWSGLSIARSSLIHFGFDRTDESPARARESLDRALELQPELPEAHMAAGWYYYLVHRDYGQALAAFRQAESKLPNATEVLEAQGYIRRRQGDFAEAARLLKRAFALNPRDAATATEIGTTLRYLRSYSEADSYFDTSIRLSPDQRLAYLHRARNFWEWRGDTGAARRTLESMPAQEDAASLYVWVWQQIYEGDYEGALRSLEATSIELVETQDLFVPRSQIVGLVSSLMARGEASREAYESARRVLEQEAERRPEDPRVQSSLGLVYAGLRRRQLALLAGSRAVELSPESRDAMEGRTRRVELAHILVMTGDHLQALAELESLLSVPSELSIARLRLDPRWEPLRGNARFEALGG